jgi:hypothetical protein
MIGERLRTSPTKPLSVRAAARPHGGRGAPGRHPGRPRRAHGAATPHDCSTARPRRTPRLTRRSSAASRSRSGSSTRPAASAASSPLSPSCSVRHSSLRTSGRRPRRVGSLSARVHHLAATTLSKVGESDLSWIAAERALYAAEQADDPLVLASGACRHARLPRERQPLADRLRADERRAAPPLRGTRIMPGHPFWALPVLLCAIPLLGRSSCALRHPE